MQMAPLGESGRESGRAGTDGTAEKERERERVRRELEWNSIIQFNFRPRDPGLSHRREGEMERGRVTFSPFTILLGFKLGSGPFTYYPNIPSA